MLNIKTIPSFKKVGGAFTRMGNKKHLKEALTQFSFLIESESKKVAPVDTGRLRASIFTRIQGFSATIKPNTNYAGFVHWGTRYMRARPFMKWGFSKADSTMWNGKSPFTATFEKGIKQEIKRI